MLKKIILGLGTVLIGTAAIFASLNPTNAAYSKDRHLMGHNYTNSSSCLTHGWAMDVYHPDYENIMVTIRVIDADGVVVYKKATRANLVDVQYNESIKAAFAKKGVKSDLKGNHGFKVELNGKVSKNVKYTITTQAEEKIGKDVYKTSILNATSIVCR